MATGSTGVYGGVDYNTADAATKKRLLAQAQQLKADSGFKQSETNRALEAYRSRQAAGQDTSAQAKYLTSQLGYTGALPGAAPVSPAATAMPTASPAASPAKTNTGQSSELMDLMKAYATKQATPFSYDANSDPAYQAALQRARANIQTGNNQVQADTNRRGILNSTITTDRGSEIAAQEMGNVETTVLPQLMQQAYQRYADQQNQEQQQFANQGNLAQMYTSEDQRGIDNTNTRAGLTGNLPGDEQAQQLYSQLLALKQQAEATGITAAERTKLSNQANGIRAMLSNMGVDVSQLGANSSYGTASQVTPSIRTLQGQQLDTQKQAQAQQQEQQQWENRFNYGQAIGKFGNGQQTLQAQQMDTANKQYAEQQAYKVARDAISDKQWQSQFDESVRQYGLGYGLQQLSQSDDSAYRQAQLALSQDDNARQWVQLDYQQSQPGAGQKYVGMTANQVLDNIKSLYTEPVMVQDPDYPNDPNRQIKSGTQLTKDPTKRTEMFESVVDAGLSEAETKQVLLGLGYTMKDIEARVKQYSGN
ncbi:hypothetical protein [Paenibacillus wynnii]|uniref:Uncharacterized protein n=1 Tax=Paenibacillus wynnii TaxID=268407 RepID=A0A098MBZ2_9BACL|nr:hypothetical protein [Paenibacillus wynnii]KGE20064.1 hypothetical protein PWYN_12480 [Paenibacillus wynnii]